MTVNQIPVKGATYYGPEHQTYTQGWTPAVGRTSEPPPETTQDRTRT